VRSATLQSSVTITGRGLFSGLPCRATLHPAKPGSGLAIRKDGVTFPLNTDTIIERPSCTVVGADGCEVAVVEHLLCALWAAGIDTALIECDGPEIPNHDGSALPFYEALLSGGRVEHGERSHFTLTEPIRIEENGDYIEVSPADSLTIEYHFAHPELGASTYSAKLDRSSAPAEILPARSFITDREAAAARAAGFLRNDNVEDALVLHVTDGAVTPATPLRFPDEFPRHKVLDFLGDLYLAPFEWTGRVTAHRSGHRLNRQLARRLVAEFRRRST
jgi:UDP-3-O-[3-hydroxymyristoyl] N-acetylglucosamine deacetylase